MQKIDPYEKAKQLPDLGYDPSPAAVEYLSRFGLLGGGDVSGKQKQAWAGLTYSQPTPLGLLDIGADASYYSQPGFSQTQVDALRAAINKDGDGFGFGVQTDRAGRNPYFELTYGKRF